MADLVRLEFDVDGRAVTILECRAPWSAKVGPEWSRHPVARLRYVVSRGVWTLYWRDRHLRFHRYAWIGPTPDVGVLLNEIATDPTTIFWG